MFRSRFHSATRIFLSLALIVVSCSSFAADPAFVSVKGTHFSRHNAPYYIAGTNMWYGGYLGATGGSAGKVGDRARLIRELDNLKTLGINNLRVLAVSESSDIPAAVRPATTNGFGKYDEELLAGLDFLLAEMTKRDMTAVLYLNNFWQWSGGMGQYMSWIDGKPMQDPNITNDYTSFQARSAEFYRSAKANEEYRKTIRKIVQRTNTITGKPYVSDPTIMSWQLANEPRPGNEQASDAHKRIFIDWINDTAKFIHQLDANHLVSSGNEGIRGSADDKQLFIDSHKTSQIDYLTYHLWPRNWSWFDQHNADKTWDNALKKSIDYINWHIDVAKQMNKPIVIEEFGLDRDGGSYDVKATTTYRDRFYREVLGLTLKRAQAGEAAAGFNFWAWNGAGRTPNADYWWKPGNDFNGDPPQEQQGMYGVFDSDISTILLLKEFSDNFRAIK
jgi:mannan endo-1,4-beta-mannosidase